MKTGKLRRVVSGTVTKWWDDNAMRLSAALSYYTLFSLAPLLTIALALAGLVVDGTMVQQEVFSQSPDLLGAAGAQAVGTMLDSASRPTLPVIVMTAADAKDQAVLAMQAGAQAYLLKPFDTTELIHLIDHWIGAVEAS